MLTGARFNYSLELARLLHAQGHKVFTAESMSLHICRFSKAVSKNFKVPSPRFEPHGFIKALCQITEKEKIDLLIPAFEEIFLISKCLDYFPKRCQVFASSFSFLKELHNKWSFIQKLRMLGIKAPKSVLIRSNEELKKLSFQTPYILKPCYSRAAQKIRRIDSAHFPCDLPISFHYPWIAQEFLEGKQYCSYSIAHGGKVTAHSLYPVNFSINESSCLNFEAIDHPEIYLWIEYFLAKTKFTGQIAFDFIQLPSKELYAIECNPRGTSGLHLFSSQDKIDQAFFNETKGILLPKKGREKQIVTGMLLYGWKTKKVEKRFSIFLKKLFRTRDVIFSWKDLKPFLLQPFLFCYYLLRSRKLKLNLPSMFTFDLEWDGENHEIPTAHIE